MPGESEQLSPAAPRFVGMIPTYNHAGALRAVLNGLTPLNLPVIAVNDGATDDTAAILAEWQAADPSARSVASHDVNRGKAAALHTGFSLALSRGFTHALTIDSDGQHDPSDLNLLLAQCHVSPNAIVIGCRPPRMPGCPRASLIGRALSNFFVWVASGVRVRDSQSGLRAYPLAHIGTLGASAGRYGFETEVITRAGWAGLDVREVPISCRYDLPGGRVTHFHKTRDTWAAVRMHARLITRSLLPMSPVPRLAAAHDEDETYIGTIFRRACWWLGPRRLYLMIRGDEYKRERVAASVATGLLMATIPAYGIKTVACLWLAARFRLHPTLVIAVSSLSTPPLGFFFVLVSVITGNLVLHGRLPGPSTFPDWSEFTFADVRGMLLEWVLGSLIAGPVLGAAGYVLTRLLLRTQRRAAPTKETVA
jgi:glycosyltransferase involved in cell wall biosynthesis